MAGRLRIENIQMTIHALNNDFSGRLASPGYDATKIIHIHRRNRAYVWSKEMQLSALDSIMKGYYIPPIICASRIVNGIERREVMEGGNRITTFRRLLSNQVKELTLDERHAIEAHPITLVVMRGLTNAQQREMFRRLNKNVKVTDGQLYAMSEEDSPLVREALSLLNDDAYPLRNRLTAHFFDMREKDNDGKKDLENAIALISGALYGPQFITKSFSRQEEKVESQDPIDRTKVVTVLGQVLDVFRMVDQESELTDRRKMKGQWPVGRYLGVILYDIQTATVPIAQVQQKWAKYILLARRGTMFADEAIKITGAQNLNPDRLKRMSVKVEIFMRDNRLATEAELKAVRHSEDVDDETEEGDDDVEED